MEFLTALLSIVVIDLVLAGDNAILIGMAARNLPANQQRKVILWGAAGAVVIRVIATILVVYLLEITGLHLVGGLVLLYIAYTLLNEEDEHEEVKAQASIGAAIRTVIVADALMGLDNVLAVAGASHGNILLVTIGLLISIPFVMWGSTLIIKLMDKFPALIVIGAAVLAWTATKMIVKEGFLHDYFGNPVIHYGFELLAVIVIAAIGLYKIKKKTQNQEKVSHTGS